MSELKFDYLISLNQDYENTCISNEPNNRVLQFGIKANRQINANAQKMLEIEYPNLGWRQIPAIMTSQAISKLGIKSFPLVGAHGFFKLLHEERSIILAPIFFEGERYKAPTVMWIQTPTTIIFNITDPTDVKFEAYRIIMRMEFKAYEYITYQKQAEVPKPPEGVYDFSIMAYIDDNLASQIRDYVGVIVTPGGSETIIPPQGGGGTAHGLPVGGDQGQVLTKASTVDFDVEWTNNVPGPSVELQVSTTHVQWRVVGTPTWIDLVPLSEITGGLDQQTIDALNNAIAQILNNPIDTLE